MVNKSNVITVTDFSSAKRVATKWGFKSIDYIEVDLSKATMKVLSSVDRPDLEMMRLFDLDEDYEDSIFHSDESTMQFEDFETVRFHSPGHMKRFIELCDFEDEFVYYLFGAQIKITIKEDAL